MFANLSANIATTWDKVMNLKNKPDLTQEKRINELKLNIEHTKAEIQLAMKNFNNVTEPKLIDFYIYKIQSEQTRYDQLISEYKALQGFPQNLSME